MNSFRKLNRYSTLPAWLQLLLLLVLLVLLLPLMPGGTLFLHHTLYSPLCLSCVQKGSHSLDPTSPESKVAAAAVDQAQRHNIVINVSPPTISNDVLNDACLPFSSSVPPQQQTTTTRSSVHIVSSPICRLVRVIHPDCSASENRENERVLRGATTFPFPTNGTGEFTLCLGIKHSGIC